jgi:hypothetical protein
MELRGGFVCGFRTCLRNSLRFLFRRKLLLHLGRDGVGVHLVGRGCFAQHLRGIAPRCRQQNRGFDQDTPAITQTNGLGETELFPVTIGVRW